ncbi:hypothetical protein [Kaarinaea lacus]
MTTPQQSGPALPFATFLILAALGSFIWKTGPLESSRPTSKDDGAYNRAQEFQVPTRLWQDPLKTVYQEFKQGAPSTDGLSLLIDKITEATTGERSLTVLGVMVSKGAYAEIEEQRRRRRYAVLAGLAESSFIPTSAEYIHYLYLNLDSTRCLNRDQKTEVNQNCQEVIPYEWYEDDEFAASTGGDSKKSVLVLWLNDDLFSEKPYQKFTALANTLKGEEGLTKAPEGIKPIGDNARNISIYILGPARSEALATMVKHANFSAKPEATATLKETKASEKKQTPQKTKTIEESKELKEKKFYEALPDLGIKGFHILSPTATISDYELQSFRKGEPGDESSLIAPRGCEDANKTCFTFLRTISHDGKVIASLKEELSKRRINVASDNIALISEWDTSFGRALPRNFQAQKGKNPGLGANIHEFSYLRGIDGRTIGAEDIGKDTAANTSSKNDKQQSKNALIAAENTADIRRPVGTGQYDYLRRLATRIKALDETLKHAPKQDIKVKPGIRAIGILGSDVYDKLLILRTLRKSFPGIVFFTTDLDAQLLHPDEFIWARNLIVASSFDMQLNDKLQGRIPPFRDSYQTSVFFSTMLAVKAAINIYGAHKDAQVKATKAESNKGAVNPETPVTNDILLRRLELIDHWVQPQIFEVGRHGAVSLNPVTAQKDHLGHHHENWCADLSTAMLGDAALCHGHKVHPDKPDSLFWQTGMAIFFVTFIVIFALHQVRPQSGIQVLWSAISVVLIFSLVIVAFSQGVNEEPLSFTDGISAWPTTFLRFITMLLAIYFLITASTNMRNNRLRLTRDYHLCKNAPGEPSSRDVTVKTAIKNFFRALKKLREVDPRSWFVLVFIIAAVVIMRKTRIELTINEIHLALIIWVGFFAVWYAYIYKFAKVRSINEWVKDIDSKKEIEVTSLWGEYSDAGETRHRVYRSLTIAFLYMSFASIIFFLFQQDTNVWRGIASIKIGMALTMLPVVIMIFLIFFVTDATRLCICWIKAMGQKKLKWDEGMLSSFGAKLNVNKEYIEEWLKIQLIADRTHEIGQLIYYPFIIIILMLISRSTYFDNWGFPQALAIVVTVNLVILSSVAMLLRKQAEKVRRDTIGNLEHELVKVAGCRSPEGNNLSDRELTEQKCHIEQINKLLEEIRNIKSGAFRSVLDQPLVRAGLILLGGLGLGLSEYSFLLW